MTKVSIIVPVYNVEKYLRDCLESLINQTLTDIEIICVNDGSTDNSLAILEEYKLKDDRIKIFSQENKGVSVARNLGIEKATGEYLTFLDSDDRLELNTCEILYKETLARNSDFLFFGLVNDKNKNSGQKLVELLKKINTGTTIFADSYIELFLAPKCTAAKLYKTSLIKENNITFPINISVGEDRVFYIQACICAKAIGIINNPLYLYRDDAANSLSKNNFIGIAHTYMSDQIIKKILYNEKKYDGKQLYKHFLEINSTNTLLHFWNSFYNRSSKVKNLKYLLKQKKEYNIFSRKELRNSQSYNQLVKTITEFRSLYFKKLFEPIFELEFRRNRIALYLFENQVLNFSTRKLNMLIYKCRYFFHLLRLRCVAKKRKIRIGLWMTENQKWSSFESLYRSLSANENFETFVLLTYLKKGRAGVSKLEHMEQNIEFLEKNNIKYELVYDYKYNSYSYLKDKKPDIVFYQQPWSIHDNQNLWNTSKNALTCYVPYCYYSLDTDVNYLFGFHGCLWKYFVETEMHKKDYETKYQAKNCIAFGSTKLDNFKTIKPNGIWSKKNKKRIIYAPHHTFAYEYNYQMATFKSNGEYILNLAKSHPEFEWIFRPHPVFYDRVIEFGIMKPEEINNYFSEWEKIGKIYPTGDYYELFSHSDCLITDCISFLAEYLPTGKPVIHLRKENQHREFNSLLQIITDSYYKIYDNKTLQEVFDRVVLNDDDYKKEERLKALELLMLDKEKTTGEKITEYLLKELRLGE